MRRPAWCRPTAGIQHALHQLQSFVFLAYARKVAGCRMARATGVSEVGAPRFGIAGCEIGDIHRAATSTIGFELCLLRMNVGDHRLKIYSAEMKRGHAAFATLHHRSDLVSAIIRNDHIRACEVWAAFPTRCIATVAEAALRNKLLFAGANRFRRVVLFDRALGDRLRSGALRGVLREGDRHKHEENDQFHHLLMIY